MKIIVQAGRTVPKIADYPAVVLRRDGWDDYGFRTMFVARLHLSKGKSVDLEHVKVLRRGQDETRTDMPEGPVDELPATHCSLGQAFSYYEQLHQLGPEIYEPVLRSMRDVVFNSRIRRRFEQEKGFEVSLLRFDGARRALKDAPGLFRRSPTRAAQVQFRYRFPEATEPVEFELGENANLPDRIAAVIGYNGAGKTRLLANLAQLTYADSEEASEPKFIEDFGEFVGKRPEFGGIVAVSYSAFDDFELPTRGEGNRAAPRNYTYCGLRDTADREANEPVRLKDFGEIADEFHRARNRARKTRSDLLTKAIVPLSQEPSFRTIAEIPAIAGSPRPWIRAFRRLSAGHKIVLHIVVQLCAYIEPRSIVLLDEPELHLHPPLVAALLRAVRVVLAEYDSFAIVATHSPVVLQEVPGENVWVLRRDFGLLEAHRPESETFGENVGLLTREVFSLDSSNTDYQGVLKRLARTHSLESISDMFQLGLSSQARSLVLSYQRRAETKS